MSVIQIPLSAFFGWFIAQAIKTLIDLIEGKKIKTNVIYRTGGMPSAHSAFVSAITVAILFSEGISNLFFVCLAFSLIVIVDAFGVRNQVGHHAKLINILITKIKINLKKHRPKLLRELVGHSGIQVFFGIITGCLAAIIINAFFI